MALSLGVGEIRRSAKVVAKDMDPPPSPAAVRDGPGAEEWSMASLHAAFIAHPPGTKLPETRILIRGQVIPRAFSAAMVGLLAQVEYAASLPGAGRMVTHQLRVTGAGFGDRRSHGAPGLPQTPRSLLRCHAFLAHLLSQCAWRAPTPCSL